MAPLQKIVSLLLLLTALFWGCDDASSDNAPVVEAPETHFVSATQRNEISLDNMKLLAQLSGFQDMSTMIRYGVNTYTLVYETEYNGNPIEASGLLFLPQGLTDKAPLLSLQHGTTFLKDDAPSANADFTGMELFASAGYIAIMPDFIGYGQSKDIFHPYYDEAHSARAVIDMIKSAKEFLTKENIAFNDQLFMAGYSEGGYVTLAAAKELETNPDHGLEVTAVAAGAGGYDLTAMLSSITTSTTYAYPSYLAFVLMAYNTTYGWNKPLTYFFQDSYAAALSTYMNGQYGGGTINSKLTTKVADLLNPAFFANLKNNSGEDDLREALQENNVSGWTTALPMRLYHGTNDEIIPYQNSELTLQNFKNAGSTTVSLTPIAGGSHGNSFVPMLQDFVPWFESLR